MTLTLALECGKVKSKCQSTIYDGRLGREAPPPGRVGALFATIIIIIYMASLEAILPR